MSVARSVGVEEQVKDLMNLSQDLRKSGIDVSDCLAGSVIVKQLRSFGVDASSFSDFVSTVYTEATTQNLKPIEFVALCTELKKIKKEAGKSYLEVVDEYRSLKESNQVLSGENVRLEKERRENKRVLQQQIKEKDTTLETLSWFAETRENLKKFGLEVEDIDDLAVLMQNFKENEYDADRLLEFYSGTMELQTQKQELETDLKSQEQKLRLLKEENKQCEETLEANRELVAAVEDIRSIGLNCERIRGLIEKVIEISSRHGKDKIEALDDFFSNLSEHYEPLLGYKNQINRF
jgi:hypothetical protein